MAAPIASEARREALARGLKWCGFHKAFEPIGDFGSSKDRPDGLQSSCRVGLAIKKNEWDAKKRASRPQTYYSCIDCGETFAGHPLRERCDPCRVEHERLNLNRRVREYKGRNRRPPILTFICEGCGEEFPRRFPNSHPRFCPPCGKEYQRQARCAISRKYRTDHKETLSVRTSTRRRTDPKFALRMCMSAGVYQSLKSGKNGASWELLVGYTTTALMSHLRRQFVKGMTWANYGSSWEIDHIRPIASFKFASPVDQDFKDCWALSNMRPLWRSANRSKRHQLIYLL